MSEKELENLQSEKVQGMAEACVKWVKENIGIELDYTQDTLPVLDHYLFEASKEFQRADTNQSGVKEEVLGLIIPSAGAYFGELLCKHFPSARWHAPLDVYEQWRIEFGACFMHFNPIGMALEAALQKQEAGYNAHLSLLPQDQTLMKELLERSVLIDEKDYFRLSVRFEVIEQTFELLSSKERQQNDQPMFFGPDVYEAEMANLKK